MWVKVCGLRDRRQAEVAVEAGADAIGFVLAESPRQVSVEAARLLGEDLPIERIVVTVDATPDDVIHLAERAGATGIQPHGRHSAAAGDAAVAAGFRVLHPVSVGEALNLGGVPFDRTPLLDTYEAGWYGGTGKTFDWSVVAGETRDFVLAGGLNPTNVACAVTTIRPWGVDASSGLESAPGVKDSERIRAFVREAKQA